MSDNAPEKKPEPVLTLLRKSADEYVVLPENATFNLTINGTHVLIYDIESPEKEYDSFDALLQDFEVGNL